MGYWHRTKYCRLCGDAYKCAKDGVKPGFCCDWCRVTFFRLVGPLLRKLELKGCSSSKVRYKSRQKREKKFDRGSDEQ